MQNLVWRNTQLITYLARIFNAETRLASGNFSHICDIYVGSIGRFNMVKLVLQSFAESICPECLSTK